MKKSVQFLLLFLMCISASWTWASDAPERTVLFNMGDYDSQYWRIPALVTAADNSLVAVVDKRGSSLGDLPNTIPLCREEVPITVKIGRSRLSLLRAVTVKHMAIRLWYSIKRREI